MRDFRSRALDLLSKARLSRRGGSDASRDLLDERVGGRFIAGPTGDIGWTAPDAELFRFHVEQTRHVAAHVCGRELYQEMLVWATPEQTRTGEAELEFARIWRATPKVVSSRTLKSVAGNARLATDNIATEVSRLRNQPGDGVVSIGGGASPMDAIAEDLIDEYRLFVNPVILGGGTRYITPLDKPIDLRLTESCTFNSASFYLRYQRTRRACTSAQHRSPPADNP